ncbi:MAG: hypothetical protein ABI398_01845 [Devosia sp.]
MQFITALFGGSENTMLNSAFALGIVLVLIVLGLWVLKLITSGAARLGNTRKRVSIVDTAIVDGKRKVVIIRRDNIEHLIMTGGPEDLIIESGIAVPEPAPLPRRPIPHRQQPTAGRPDMAPPTAAERPVNVSREAVDRLRDLARPAPLKPRTALRHTALLRPVDRPDAVIPIGPELRIDNSAGTAGDSAKPGADGNEPTPVGGRNRFFRSVTRDRS